MPHMAALRLALSGLALVPALALAGPLDPPPGPVAPTHKTLTEVEPRTPVGPDTTPGDSDSVYRIAQPGSYYLTGDVLGQVGKHGIEIAAGQVTLDLNGYVLRGVPEALDGIHATIAARNLIVRNGTITGWNDGIDALSAGLARFEALSMDSNLGNGLRAGDSSTISDCTARFSGENGFYCSNYVTIRRCIASGSGESGIVLFGAGSAIDCTAHGNDLHGISAGSRSTVRDCNLILNGNDTGGAGVHVGGQYCRIEGNSLVQNGIGLHVVATRNIIAGNSAAINSTNYSIAGGNTAGPVTSDLSTAGHWANIAH